MTDQSSAKWAKLIKATRLGLKESQTTFGARFNASATAVSYWENGQTDPPGAVTWWIAQQQTSPHRSLADVPALHRLSPPPPGSGIAAPPASPLGVTQDATLHQITEDAMEGEFRG